MRISLATPDELEEIREIDAREFRGAEFPESSVFWVVDHDPEIGYCSAVIGPDPVREGGAPVAHLTRGYVGEGHRGAGMQLRLVRLRLRWARAAGVARAQTYTWHDNVPSMRTLGRAGFLPLRAGSGYIRWEKEL